jgi:hypothetical protein
MKEDVAIQSSTMELPNEIFLKEVCSLIEEGHDVTIRVRGVSMRPFLEDRRDKVVLTRVDSVEVGDAVLAEIAPGKYVYHRIVDIVEEKVTLKGDGNIYGTEHCRIENVVASTRQFVRKGRCYSPKGMTWRWYSALWPSNAFMRRVLLKLYRIFGGHR